MFDFTPISGVKYRFDYSRIASDLNELQAKGDDESAKGAVAIFREMARNDLFFLLYFMLGLTFLNNKFHVPRIYEVQKENNSTLDLWAREFGKSTIITKGLTIFEILNDPEVTIGILSYNRSLAKAFLRGIKQELSMNGLLKAAFPDILYQNPDKESPKWSEDDGIIVKRKSILPESTVEAWGLVDGMPTGKHFKTRVYDDIVTKDTVGTPEQIEKTKEAFRMSHNIGRKGGKVRVIGTIYHYADMYRELEKRTEDWKVRKYPAEDAEGNPVYLSKDELARKKRDMGAWVYSSQMLLAPIAEGEKKFQIEWIKHFVHHPALNVYIVCDPAGTKTNKSDYTVMWAFGVDAMKNRFVLDCVRDRLNLGERWKKLRYFVEKWRPMAVGYERYALMGDIDYIKEKMADEGFYFTLYELGGHMSKNQRIETLMPLFQEGKILFPKYIPYRGSDGKVVDIVQVFISEEYLSYPYSEHDDMMDCLARMTDEKLGVVYPFTSRPNVAKCKPYNPLEKPVAPAGWMGL